MCSNYGRSGDVHNVKERSHVKIENPPEKTVNENGQVEFKIPSFDIYENDWDKVLEKDNDISFDLSRLK